METKTKDRPTEDNAQSIAEGSERIGIATPVAPPQSPDPARGSLIEGRDITAAFTELIREGKACALSLFGRAVRQSCPDQWRSYGPRFEEQLTGLLKSFLSNGGGNVYAATLKRALLTWMARVPRIYTDEEASANDAMDRRLGQYHERSAEGLLALVAFDYRIHCNRSGIEDPESKELRKFRAERYELPDETDAKLLKHFEHNPLPAWYRNGRTVDEVEVEGPNVEGLPAGSTVHATRAEVSTEERHRLWIEEFAAEVELCVDRFADRTELPIELARLIETLRSFEVDAGEAKAFGEHLRTTGIGSDVLTMMQHGKDRLLQRLEEIAKEWPVDVPSNEKGQRLTWKGSKMALCELIHLLEVNGWIEQGKSRMILAARVHATFQDSDGNPMELSSLRTYLGKEYVRELPKGVEFKVSKKPK